MYPTTSVKGTARKMQFPDKHTSVQLHCVRLWTSLVGGAWITHEGYREPLKYPSQVVWSWLINLSFVYLLQAEKRNFFTPFHTTWEGFFRSSLYSAFCRHFGAEFCRFHSASDILQLELSNLPGAKCHRRLERIALESIHSAGLDLSAVQFFLNFVGLFTNEVG